MSTTHDDVGKDHAAIQLEEADVLGKDGEKDSTEVHLNQKMERKALLKLDLLLVSLMCSLYLLAFLDRANIGNARVAGLQTALGISDHQYQIGTSRRIHALKLKLTPASNNRDIRPIHPGRASIQSDTSQSRTSHPPSLPLCLMGYSHNTPIAGQDFWRPRCLSLLLGTSGGWTLPWYRPVSFRLLPQT